MRPFLGLSGLALLLRLTGILTAVRAIPHLTDAGQVAAGEVLVEIAEVGFEVFECVSLGPIVGKLLEIAEPEAGFFPVDNLRCLHAAFLQPPLGGQGSAPGLELQPSPPDRFGRRNSSTYTADCNGRKGGVILVVPQGVLRLFLLDGSSILAPVTPQRDSELQFFSSGASEAPPHTDKQDNGSSRELELKYEPWPSTKNWSLPSVLVRPMALLVNRWRHGAIYVCDATFQA